MKSVNAGALPGLRIALLTLALLLPVSYTHLDVYKRQVSGTSAASSATRSYPSTQRVLSLIPGRWPLASFGSRAHIHASRTPKGSRSVLTAYVGCTYRPVSYTHLDVYKRQPHSESWYSR